MTQVENNISESSVSHKSIEFLQESVKVALEEVMGDSSPEMLNEMSMIFLEDAVPLMEQIKTGYASQDISQIIIAAHTLKGSSATIGLESFAKICQSLEASSKQNDMNAIGELIPILEAEYAEVQVALGGFLL